MKILHKMETMKPLQTKGKTMNFKRIFKKTADCGKLLYFYGIIWNKKEIKNESET